MSSSHPAPKPSKWGSLLQQAVAGVESRLDTMLLAAPDDQGARQPVPAPASKTAEPPPPPPPPPPVPVPPLRGADDGPASQLRPNGRPSDRLQERLARAVARRESPSGARASRSPAPPSLSLSSSGVPSRTASPGRDADRRPDVGRSSASTDVDRPESSPPSPPTRVSLEERRSTRSRRSHSDATDSGLGLGLTTTTNGTGREKAAAASAAADDSMTEATAHEYEALLAQLRSDYEHSEARRQEEAHTATERIDALQAKLKFLARDTAESARSAAASAPKASVERKLAEREEQLALLMDEGQRLSKTELANQTLIKKLRAKLGQEEKRVADALRTADQAHATAAESQEKRRRAEAAEKRSAEKVKVMAKVERDADAWRAERDASAVLVASLKAQMQQLSARSSEEDHRMHTAALEAERKLVVALREELSRARMDQQASEERARAEMRELKERAERERERAQVAEAELRREQSMLESKMEVLRTRAEEMAVGSSGEAQVKLFRQMETLQTQYALSSENWQRIEESLMARVAHAEKERDDLARKEHDLRQRTRATNSKAKRAEDELESATSQLQAREQDLRDRDGQLEKVRARAAEELEAALAAARSAFDRERAQWQAELGQRLAAERQKGRDDGPSQPPSRTESPVHRHPQHSHARGFVLDPIQTSSQSRRARGRMLSSDTTLASGADRPWSAHASSPAAAAAGQWTPPDAHVQVHNGGGSSMPATPTPTADAPEHDALLHLRLDSPSAHHDRMVSGSASTAGAGAGAGAGPGPGPGPSVQLVERMSAAVRRLESEKGALTDELARCSAARDEARLEVARLMREAEAQLPLLQELRERVRRLERDHDALHARYQTTLEMLGEKSERVEELLADVVDLKAIYRQLLLEREPEPEPERERVELPA
ncbi:MAG: hypothetical protein M1826_000902 [Phylliscum demangeonii]|nr:MAG: hypothetical protein M1826_000902 [Phylliscum demangeonii]